MTCETYSKIGHLWIKAVESHTIMEIPVPEYRVFSGTVFLRALIFLNISTDDTCVDFSQLFCPQHLFRNIWVNNIYLY